MGDTSAKGFLEKGYSRGWFTDIPNQKLGSISPEKTNPTTSEQIIRLSGR